MFEFFISLIAGLIGCAIVAYALRAGFKKVEQIDEFVKHVTDQKDEDEEPAAWWKFWVIITVMFLTVIEIAQWIGTNLAGVKY